jgi:hypothetical protein
VQTKPSKASRFRDIAMHTSPELLPIAGHVVPNKPVVHESLRRTTVTIISFVAIPSADSILSVTSPSLEVDYTAKSDRSDLSEHKESFGCTGYAICLSRESKVYESNETL